VNKTKPSDLRHRVDVQYRVVTNVDGQESSAWTTQFSAWAAIEPAARPAQVDAEAMNDPTTHVVTLRYRAGIAPRMRLLYGSRILDVVAVIDVDERHFWIELQCVEGLTAG
jgi:SPP1 family predicted phage head-tail adaptor